MPAFCQRCRYPQQDWHQGPSGDGHFSIASRNLVGPSSTSGFQSHALSLLAEIVVCLVAVALLHRPALNHWVLPRRAPYGVIPLNYLGVRVSMLTWLVVVPRDRVHGSLYLNRVGARLTVMVRDLPHLGAILFCVDVGGKGAGWARCVCLHSHGWRTFFTDFSSSPFALTRRLPHEYSTTYLHCKNV